MTADGPTILDTVDLGKKLPRPQYRAQLRTYQAQLNRLTRQAREARPHQRAGVRGLGRGRQGRGDPAPDFRHGPGELPDRAHPPRPPRRKRRIITCGVSGVTCRAPAGCSSSTAAGTGASWWNAIEGFASESEWRRAYSEINAFEEQLSEHGILLMKFWLHIDADEQMRRFQTRLETPYKKFKITEEDYPQPREVARLRTGPARNGPAHQHRVRPLASGVRQQQAVGARRGAEDALPAVEAAVGVGETHF